MLGDSAFESPVTYGVAPSPDRIVRPEKNKIFDDNVKVETIAFLGEKLKQSWSHWEMAIRFKDEEGAESFMSRVVFYEKMIRDVKKKF